jgi:hypothetical protein
MFKFMLKIRPNESGRLAALVAIASPPAAASNAFRLARIDISELDAGIAAHRAGNSAAFLRDFKTWLADERASRAFAALGAKACA